MQALTTKHVGILGVDGNLLQVSDCNSQVDRDTYDGPALWDDLRSAKRQVKEEGGLGEGCRFVKVTMTVEDL